MWFLEIVGRHNQTIGALSVSRPRIVQHSFGSLGSGGPIGALNRVLATDITDMFEFRQVPQPHAAGGINVRLVLTMAREMRDFRPDLAHIRGLGNEGFHGIIAARVARVPRILVSVHGSVGDLVHGRQTLRRWIVGRILEPLTLRLATHVVTVCEAALDKPILGPVAGKVAGVVPNGVDLSSVSDTVRRATRQALGIDDEDVVLIIVGRLVVDKGHLDLFQALDTLPVASQSRVHLLVVGDGPDAGLLSARSRSVDHVKVHMLGRRSDVPDLLGAADIAVVASRHENLSNALLEAMAMGLPVIATRVGGNTEVVSRGGGLLVPAADPAALAEAILGLLGDAERRTRLGRDARAVVESSYTTEHMKNRLAAVYTSILQS